MNSLRLCVASVMAALAFSETLEVKQGEELDVPCPESGTVEFWIHPSGRQLAVPPVDKSYVANETNLVIQSATEADGGRFACISRAGQRVSYGSVQVVVKPSGPRYWQNDATNVGLAFLAAILFILACAGIFLVHQCRYERRHKSDGVMNGDGVHGAHSNPALDVEAETHM
ncbi:uncharacterized protein LOC119089722 [Pollicipes pollicipes]|uniref:uncharacterized protein LOC119089722 n=1 Tax=Pollicipes pollicipes TaxID=41117 RepID=UPI001884E496|nr:uncharacterized protein LOC119089722 [Pollicipes pollicipes]